MNIDAALNTYLAEGRELLVEMEDALLEVEGLEQQDELLNAIFRAAHTIKGSAGLFGLDAIVSFTHLVESILERLRSAELALTGDAVALLLDCKDHIGVLLDQVESAGDELDPDTKRHEQNLVAALMRFDSSAPATAQTEPMPAAPDETFTRALDGDGVVSACWHISLRFGADSLRDGMDPLSFIRYLGTLGEIKQIAPVDEPLPMLSQMDAESCYLGFELRYLSDADKTTIESVFDFIREQSQVRILPPHSKTEAFVELIRQLPEEDMYLGEMLVRCGTLTEYERQKILLAQAAETDPSASRQLGELVVAEGLAEPEVVAAAVRKQSSVREAKAKDTQTVRVDADKLDHLINLVGELVTAGAGTAMHAKWTDRPELGESVETLARLVEEVRDAALGLRMVQIGATFNRFHRVVRDVSKELNKDIELMITGADTELDKTVVEKITDPLMHLVRNSIDHGIESPETRVALGKPAKGKVHLNAYHESGSIVIEITDDGAGLNRERILEKAIAQGLANEHEPLEDADVFQFIFEPGFSTTTEVSNLSGRGVGMDVVKRNITALRGTVDVDSRTGEGTAFRICLPLTLAIIDGFMIGVDDETFVVPLDSVLECVELGEFHVTSDRRQNNFINLRGQALPVIFLRSLFGLAGEARARENVVVVASKGAKLGIVVDRLLGESQTVIKPLGRLFSHLKAISGSTVLGSGEVALILDVPGLVQQVTEDEASIASAALHRLTTNTSSRGDPQCLKI